MKLLTALWNLNTQLQQKTKQEQRASHVKVDTKSAAVGIPFPLFLLQHGTDDTSGSTQTWATKANTNWGYVGMEVTTRYPFTVVPVDDLMDEQYVLQGQPGYANEIVMPVDKLCSVDGTAV